MSLNIKINWRRAEVTQLSPLFHQTSNDHFISTSFSSSPPSLWSLLSSSPPPCLLSSPIVLLTLPPLQTAEWIYISWQRGWGSSDNILQTVFYVERFQNDFFEYVWVTAVTLCEGCSVHFLLTSRHVEQSQAHWWTVRTRYGSNHDWTSQRTTAETTIHENLTRRDSTKTELS